MNTDARASTGADMQQDASCPRPRRRSRRTRAYRQDWPHLRRDLRRRRRTETERSRRLISASSWRVGPRPVTKEMGWLPSGRVSEPGRNGLPCPCLRFGFRVGLRYPRGLTPTFGPCCGIALPTPASAHYALSRPLAAAQVCEHECQATDQRARPWHVRPARCTHDMQRVHRTAYHNATPQPPVPPVRRTASKRCCCQCVLGLSLPAAPACVALCFFDAGGRSTLGYEQGASAVPAQMWQGRAQSRRRYGRGEPFALPGRAMASRRQSTRSSP
jgi:hypothetical protein